MHRLITKIIAVTKTVKVIIPTLDNLHSNTCICDINVGFKQCVIAIFGYAATNP